jgi:uncharacterized membrane protein YtjA (UPF0391 family)
MSMPGDNRPSAGPGLPRLRSEAAIAAPSAQGNASVALGVFKSSLSRKEMIMLSWALAFLLVALVAAFFGFSGAAAAAAGVAQLLFVVFLVLFAVSVLIALFRGRSPGL